MIIILGTEKDAHVRYIAQKLKEQNEDYFLFDTREFPNKVLMNWYTNFDNKGCLEIDDKTINFEEIKGVYWRNFYDIQPEIFEAGANTAFLSNIIERERKSALYSLFYSLDINWVNSINAFELHRKKAYLTHILNKNGIRVPNTLITNNKKYIMDFFEENNGEIIVKPVLGGAYTEKLTKENISPERLETLNVSPIQLQEFVSGVDIRVYAFKEHIYSMRIETDEVDFRRDMQAKLVPCELPEKVKQDCVKMMQLLDLKYSGIDIRLTDEGEYVFLEGNPAPMFIHAENQTKFPLTEELINLLKNGK